MTRGIGSVLIRVSVSLGLLALLFAFVDRPRLGRLFADLDPVALVLIVFLVTADRLLMAWKWWLLIRGRAAAVSLWAAVRAYYLASFVGWFLPMTVGADAVRVGALAGEGRTAGLVASVVLERAV
ncbi:MAG TPA: lysylphosphatidylglycerol synthase domain-containing protein, partial [Methylomirabilota bacterium]|nr:lysylphosphatidylglycerol synthase domain-containing protein [Methylomirabilota bacterium]